MTAYPSLFINMTHSLKMQHTKNSNTLPQHKLYKGTINNLYMVTTMGHSVQ